MTRSFSVSTRTAVFDSFALHGNAVSAFGFQYVSCTFAVTPFTKLMRITSGVIGVMRKMPYMLAISTADFPFFAHFTAHLIFEWPLMLHIAFLPVFLHSVCFPALCRLPFHDKPHQQK